MAAVQYNLQMDFVYQQQSLMQRLHETYDQRINMLLQQKRAMVLAFQLSFDQQMRHFRGSLLAMERGAAIAINHPHRKQEVQIPILSA